ncbi:ALK and LTK ligand 1 isoform X1 [Myxocyprinus asiaticus]|uniref:ALK and LTK ligand 1 isoform X1 n=1 Tax=Myxocyprinus asiaticus TaxID=70543 RepID=UPI002223169D|nr:ALK and LTK ligand 1 isoform X1 [Myxocyprinus asiaticus]
MRAEKRWHILLSMIILLITSSQCMDSKEVKQKERQTLLNLILQVIGDNQRDKPASRRITSGLYSASQDVKFTSREKTAHLSKADSRRPIEIVPRDIRMKDKFIEHFTAGPVKFPSECRTHFSRIYYNTRDCSQPTYYKRCARLLTRLAMSPLCTQS